MRKKAITAVAFLCAASLLTACGGGGVTIKTLKDTKVEKYVTLPDYKNLEVQEPTKMEVTDDYVKSYIHSRIDAVDAMHELIGTVENGDVLNIDYAGTIDGTAFAGGTAKAQLLEIGSGSFIAGFEDGLVGVKVGDTKELSLKFPDNYGSTELAGKDCIFVVKVNYKLAKLTDGNVALVDEGYDSAQAYQDDARNMIAEYVDYQYKTELENAIATSLVAGAEYKEVPKSLVDDYRTSLREDFEKAAEAEGITLEAYMSNTYGVAADALESEFDAIALRCAKEGLAIQAVANAEGFSISEEELNTAIANYTAAGNAEDDLDKDMIRVNLLYQKVYDLLMKSYVE